MQLFSSRMFTTSLRRVVALFSKTTYTSFVHPCEKNLSPVDIETSDRNIALCKLSLISIHEAKGEWIVSKGQIGEQPRRRSYDGLFSPRGYYFMLFYPWESLPLLENYGPWSTLTSAKSGHRLITGLLPFIYIRRRFMNLQTHITVFKNRWHSSNTGELSRSGKEKRNKEKRTTVDELFIDSADLIMNQSRKRVVFLY